MTPTDINLSQIRTDGGTQSRSILSPAVVEEYAAAMLDGATFPTIVVFYDGADHWLADGFHRMAACLLAGLVSVTADIRQGTRRDAVLFSVGANAAHGLRRSNEDKRRAVLTLLNDEEWSNWSDREIGRRAGVSNQFVSNLRLSVNDGQIASARIVERGGTTYEQNTAAIGRTNARAELLGDTLTPKDIPADDEITAEDLENDPGFQRVTEQLVNAKALLDEALAMPAAEPLTPEKEALYRRAFGTEEDRSHLMSIIDATKLLVLLPAPDAMVKAVPPTMAHAVNPHELLQLSDWFQQFARAWESREGAQS